MNNNIYSNKEFYDKKLKENSFFIPDFNIIEYKRYYNPEKATPQKYKKIELESLFSSEKNNKILLVGAPGIGKSLFCLHVAKQCLETENPLWENRFDNVFLIELKQTFHDVLKKFEENNTLPDIEQVLQKPFSLTSLKENSQNAKKNKILLILDGWNEIQFFEKHPEISKLLIQLLTFPNILLTSRSYGTPRIKFQGVRVFSPDVLGELIGFTSQNLSTYIDNFFQKNHVISSEQFKKIIEKTDNMKHLMLIPYYAHLICTTFLPKKDESDKWFKNCSIDFEFYDELIKKVKEQYLQKENETEETWDKIILCLEAITSLYLIEDHSIYFVTKDEIKEFLKNINLSLVQLLSSPFLDEFENKNYFFIHPIFQKYFATQLLMRSFLEKEIPEDDLEQIISTKNKNMKNFNSYALFNQEKKLNQEEISNSTTISLKKINN